MNGPSTRWLATISVAALLVVGCGSTIDVTSFDPVTEGGVESDASTPGDEGGTSSETGGTSTDASTEDDTAAPGDDAEAPDSEPPPDAPEPLSIDNVCERLADAVCTSSLQTCCTSKGLLWSEVGCRTAITAYCGAEVAQVKAGKGTFAPESFDACKSTWTTITTTCTVPLLDYVEAYAPCHALFPGTIAPGSGGCSQDTDCKVPAGTYAHCRDDGRCESVAIAQKDQPCNTNLTTFNKTYCDYGLYCSPSFGGSTCREGKAIGESCTQDWECGTGRRCERSGMSLNGKCAAGLGFNATCTSDAQCASGECTSGKCTNPNVTPASTALCSGTSG